ncbi:piggyBac transposable element-derived protein 3-like [Gigantopelta aegis]|uniref:piggyBac transposable element-derived protein 3-like n=1 Tax=Gigantopelta aegis TaxID=1735272 RepID=UPI001B887DA2|nr:piggyBac transposable element-derived protein 3-like [Gigantopelta aegis]
MVEEKTNTVCLRWVDNRPVSLISSYVCADPVGQARRWNRKEKKYETVDKPAIVEEYNKFMGGIDLLNMCTSMYKHNLRSARWYLYLFWYSVTIALVNAWFVYRRYHGEIGTEKRKIMRLRKFQALCAQSLTSAGKEKKKRGRPSEEDRSLHQSPPVKRPKSSKLVAPDVRSDEYNHFPTWDKSRQRCKLCPAAKPFFSYVKCQKCQVHLCLNKDRNCFYAFH